MVESSTSKNLGAELLELIQTHGLDTVVGELKSLQMGREGLVLTIVTNKGVHHIPDEILRGDVFIASEGDLDFSSIESVTGEYQGILDRLSKKLKARKWSKIYLVPFGHNTLCMQIKLLVYRVTHMETVDWFYDGRGGYRPLELNQRPIISASK